MIYRAENPKNTLKIGCSDSRKEFGLFPSMRKTFIIFHFLRKIVVWFKDSVKTELKPLLFFDHRKSFYLDDVTWENSCDSILFWIIVDTFSVLNKSKEIY